MKTDLPPPVVEAAAVARTMADRGFAVLAPDDAAALAGCDLATLDGLRGSWDRLPPDTYLRDGGRYRRRRHSSVVIERGRLQPVPHRAHWQPRDYNALHGGMRRWFEPVEQEVADTAAWTGLLLGFGGLCTALCGTERWYLEAHQFRIDTSHGIGRPTPEGAHRDGVDFVAVLMVERVGIKGGETRVFDADGPAGQRFTLAEPWSMLVLDDARVIHESTPIQPLEAHGHRDTLVLTVRREGFLDED